MSSTGIYCRPICRVKTPKQEHCHFFLMAAQAEADRLGARDLRALRLPLRLLRGAARGTARRSGPDRLS
ncbi:MAG: hypothetical protein EB006_09990, partial [Betaproteobacteria bacterium]|nr:hypothetical protein [Betaproteobacteria bacterium]